MTATALPRTVDLQATTAIRLGSPQGGVWHDAVLGWAYTCRLQGCPHWESGQPDPEHAVISLRVHETQDCKHRPRRRVTDVPREDIDLGGPLPEGTGGFALGAGLGRTAGPSTVGGDQP